MRAGCAATEEGLRQGAMRPWCCPAGTKGSLVCLTLATATATACRPRVEQSPPR